ncbi:MAG: hypothetical protein C0610_16630 [Desulfobacteraceae bacterium]|nr:MAG: hypothetical protein C0610_16630 [Desulfobacteraceae bacterium]
MADYKMSKPIPYFACICCGEDRSHPADMMGVTKEGDLWCWDCPEEEFMPDDPDKPVLKPFVPEWVERIAELEAENKRLRDAAQAVVDANKPGQLGLVYRTIYTLAAHLEDK